MQASSIPDKLLLSGFLSQTPDHVYFKDLTLRFIWVSASLARSFGCAVADVLGRTDADFFAAEKARTFRALEQKILQTGEPLVDQLVEHTWPDGKCTWSLNVAMPLHDERGEVVGLWGTNKDVTRQILLERALEEANARANAMTERAVLESQGKSEFLAVVSHEIRNPLNVVTGCAQLLHDTPLDSMQRDYVETIVDSGRATLSLIKDLLDFTKIEAGRLELEQLEFDVRDTLENVARLIAFQAHPKGIEVTLDLDPAVPAMLQGDPRRLTQILLNLGSNAVKFTERGEIDCSIRVVGVTESSTSLEFEVRDTGIGIPAYRLEAIFEPYCQAERSTTRCYGGTGLGLTIVKRIVELMGGTVSVMSEEGVGSCFSFAVRFANTARIEPSAKTTASTLKGRALIVDDHEGQRNVLARELKAFGLQVTCADSAEAALEMLKRARDSDRQFDVALIDQNMPGRHGGELARLIGSDPRLTETRLVLLTHSGQRADELGHMGLAAVLVKPVTRRELSESLMLVLAGDAVDWQGETNTVITRHLISQHRGRDKHHILVAEDVDAGRKVACHTLQRLGYRATGVANGLQAVEQWLTGQYDLILMDCEMPQLNGFEATREIRRRERSGARIPIVALTGRTMQGAERECRKAGMDSYLVKPFERELLEACLDRLLGCESIDATGEERRLTDSSMELPIDLAALRKTAGDDPAFMLEIANDFLAQGAHALKEIDRTLAGGDTDALARTVHALKTAAGALGAKALLDSASRLEIAARTGNADAALVDRVRRDIREACDCLCAERV